MTIVDRLWMEEVEYEVEGSYGLMERDIDRHAAERAREKARVSRWNLNVAILTYALLVAVVLMRFEGVPIEIVALIAVAGLSAVWFIGRRTERQQYKRFYEEELKMLQELRSGGRAEALLSSPLTRREAEILDHIAHGYMNKQIAAKLFISEQTIKNHMSSILRKLEVSDRTQAVVMAMQNGWVSSWGDESSESGSSDKVNISPQKI